ncbi:MAG: hypothetical protein KGK12_13290, partial [Armatimonadetes bacterium]|nr:hypothetical protein [Armatimonadota bacterium]
MTRTMHTWKLTLIGGLAAAAAVAAPVGARAIPAFARKYHTTCARCHSVVPRLNNYGWAFKLRGFRVPGDEGIGKILMPEDKALELLDSLPLAMRIQGSLAGSTGTGGTSSNQLDSEIDLLSAGTPAPRMGYWAEIDTIKNEDGTGGFSSEIGNVRAIFTDLISHHPTRLNLEVGKFNIDEFGISTGRILTQTPYAIYAVDPTGMGVAEQDEVTGFNLFGAIGTGIGKGVPEAKTKVGEAGKVTSAEEKEMEAELNQTEAKPPPDSPEVIAARAVLNVLVKKGTITQQDADETLSQLTQKLGPPPAPPAAATPPVPAGPMEISKSDYDVRKGLFYQAGLVTRGDVGSSKIQGYARLSYANPQGWWIGPVVYVGSNTFNMGPAASQPSFTDGFQRYGL